MKLPPKLGSLRPVEIKDVWKHEALDFTPWLLENVTELADALGLDIELLESEYPVGKFSLDLLGVIGGTQDRVIIENQLGAGDHTHFGQLLTYAGGTEAKHVIWIASKFREEYISAISWLNNGTTEDINFYAVEVSAVQIGDSLPAPLFKVVAQPNEWSKQARASASSAISGERGQLQVEFWTRYLSKIAEQKPSWTTSRQGRAQSWWPMSAKLQGASYIVAFTGRELKSEIAFISSDVEVNSERFNYLKERKEEIESAFGEELIWHFPEGNTQCIIRYVAEGDFLDQDSWDEAIDWFIDTQARLRAAIDNHVQTLKKRS